MYIVHREEESGSPQYREEWTSGGASPTGKEISLMRFAQGTVASLEWVSASSSAQHDYGKGWGEKIVRP